jgi:hypothetical protein
MPSLEGHLKGTSCSRKETLFVEGSQENVQGRLADQVSAYTLSIERGGARMRVGLARRRRGHLLGRHQMHLLFLESTAAVTNSRKMFLGTNIHDYCNLLYPQVPVLCFLHKDMTGFR